jgi:hypothetical protein
VALVHNPAENRPLQGKGDRRFAVVEEALEKEYPFPPLERAAIEAWNDS